MKFMSKSIIALAAASLFSTAAFAAPPGVGSGTTDTTSASLEWVGGLPVVSAGHYTKLTGLNGGAITQGELDVNMDGSFGSRSSNGTITTELHAYDEATTTVGDLLTDKDATTVTWSLLTPATISASGSTDTSNAAADLIGQSFAGQVKLSGPTDVITGTPDEVNRVTWTVKSQTGKNLLDLNAGDNITVSAMIQAQTDF